MELDITEKNRRDIFALIRRTIADKLGIDSGVDISACDFSAPFFSMELGAFVTLHIRGDLRGCIGFIEGFMPLSEALSQLALSAAFRDPRFSPLSKEEFAVTDFEVSILSPVEPLTDLSKIVIGRDGLIASKNGRSGLLLPQVATEYAWNTDEFLSHTCRKAGLPPDAWRDGSVTFQTFSAYVFGEEDRS